jgi:recombination protein RecT
MSETKKTQEIAKVQPTQSERFTNKVLVEFQGTGGEKLEISNAQRNLIKGYFIGIDRALKKAETERIAKNKYAKADKVNSLAYSWDNINLNDVALDVVHYSKLGLDIMSKNNINAIPYKDTTVNKYDITFMLGYLGIELVAMKYASEPPKNVTCELVYVTDEFGIIKKSDETPFDRYTFSITNPFDRGEIKGGFGYLEFADPTKNKLVFLSYKDILKRKPKYAAAEFWGGDKTIWGKDDNGKAKSTTEHIDGWHDEMCLKTLKRFVYGESNITRDPAKIDAETLRIRDREDKFEKIYIDEEISENANRLPMPETPYTDVDTETGEVIPDIAPGIKLPFNEN